MNRRAAPAWNAGARRVKEMWNAVGAKRPVTSARGRARSRGNANGGRATSFDFSCWWLPITDRAMRGLRRGCRRSRGPQDAAQRTRLLVVGQGAVRPTGLLDVRHGLVRLGLDLRVERRDDPNCKQLQQEQAQPGHAGATGVQSHGHGVTRTISRPRGRRQFPQLLDADLSLDGIDQATGVEPDPLLEHGDRAPDHLGRC